ncbi:tetraacyldisaccharide 4'-kinase [Planctomycetota bacterium]
MNQQIYQQLINGELQGKGATLTRGCLRCLGALYSGVARLRNTLYNHGILKTHRVNAAVFSVGNLTAGGTGKTPLVVWLCQQIARMNKAKSPLPALAILTRGYKTKAQGHNDEPALLAQACPDVRIVVNSNRVNGANEAITEHHAQILVLDDGFQHRRLGRDLDIVTVDATCPFGYGHQLPAGLLREPASGLGRAQAVVLTRCDQVNAEALAHTVADLHAIDPALVVARTQHSPTRVYGPGIDLSAHQLADKRIFAFCGLGNPEAFYCTLRNLGAHLVGTHSFDDHYHCTPDDVRRLNHQATCVRADYVLTTEKNWFSLPEENVTVTLPWGYLAVKLAFSAGEKELRQLIETTLAGTIPTSPTPTKMRD